MKESKGKSAEKDCDVGDQVKHPRWGEGTILFKSGQRDRTKVIVTFQEHGQKKLLLKFAKLKKVLEENNEE